MAKKLCPSALLPALTQNKKYIKKMKFLAKRKEIATAAERRGGGKKGTKKGVKKMTRTEKTGVPVQKAKTKKPVKSGAKKAPAVSVKKSAIVQGKKRQKSKMGIRKGDATAVKDNNVLQGAQQRAKKKQVLPEEIEKSMIERAIRGEEGTHDVLLSAAGGGCGDFGSETLPQYDCLPFLEDYAEQRRGEVVSADTILHEAHVFFKELGKKESAMRRVAARRLREMKDINRRGGDKDGFRYVVPRNVKEVVQQMMHNAAGVDAAAVQASNLTSAFDGDGDEKNRSERPMHRKKRRNSCYSDFYQFQVSKRWTRNAENFLNKGRAHKSMFGASKPQRSIKKL